MQDYGVPPAQYAEVLALAGDQVDGIPGLSGIGEKTALSLLRQFGSLQGVLEGAEQVGNQVEVGSDGEGWKGRGVLDPEG